MIPVTITTKALEEIQGIINQKKIPEDYCLRIGSRGGGCAGVELYLGFDTKKETDVEYTIKEIPVLFDKKDFMHLLGSTLDFVDDASERGFVFNKD